MFIILITDMNNLSKYNPSSCEWLILTNYNSERDEFSTFRVHPVKLYFLEDAASALYST